MASVPNRPGPSQQNDVAHSKDGLGGLVAAGPSKVGIDGAMRARDVAKPSAADLAEAQEELVIRYAAQRTDSRPLPQGIVPAAPLARADQQPSAQQRAIPHPPKPKETSPQDPGSSPERS
jgi:hypothetical protein